MCTSDIDFGDYPTEHLMLHVRATTAGMWVWVEWNAGCDLGTVVRELTRLAENLRTSMFYRPLTGTPAR